MDGEIIYREIGREVKLPDKTLKLINGEEVIDMENTFDSTYIVRKEKYDEFIADVERLSIAAYTIPAAILPELYKQIDMDKDIAMKVVWKPETTVAQIKEFDKTWFLKKY